MDNIINDTGLAKFYNKLLFRIGLYTACTIIFGLIVFGLRKDDHFYGLNETSDILDCIYYASITFAGSGYGNIYPQTSLSKNVVLIFTVIKLIIILWPLQRLEGEYFDIEDKRIKIKHLDTIINNLDNYSILKAS